MQSNEYTLVVPEYQRPYSWDEEKCETLWNDIYSSFTNDKEQEYYLGAIVTSKDEEGNLEIIDGQQRIISFLLLLRAFYTQLDDMKEDENVKGLKGQIEPCIWKVDKKSRQIINKREIRIKSRVLTESDNKIFHEILEKGGNIPIKKTDNRYKKNYNSLYDGCNSAREQSTLNYEDMLLYTLDKCILFPIECDNFNIAVDIFSKLNDRGLPLSDADIFKAMMYQEIEGTEKKKSLLKNGKMYLKPRKELGLLI